MFSTISVAKIVFTGGAPCLNFISAVKTEKIKKFICFTVFTGGAPLFLHHIRGKNGKNRKFVYMFYRFYRGGAPFSSTISAVKTVKIKNFLFLSFLPGGHSFFFYHIRGKTAKLENCIFLPFFSCGVAKGYPLAKQRSRTSLADSRTAWKQNCFEKQNKTIPISKIIRVNECLFPKKHTP